MQRSYHVSPTLGLISLTKGDRGGGGADPGAPPKRAAPAPSMPTRPALSLAPRTLSMSTSAAQRPTSYNVPPTFVAPMPLGPMSGGPATAPTATATPTATAMNEAAALSAAATNGAPYAGYGAPPSPSSLASGGDADYASMLSSFAGGAVSSPAAGLVGDGVSPELAATVGGIPVYALVGAGLVAALGLAYVVTR